MTRVSIRWSIVSALLIANWIGFATFVTTRAPASDRLAAEDAAFRRGVEPVEPPGVIGDIAGRPLYAWTSPERSEVVWVKVLETLNFPALVLAAFTSDELCSLLRIVPSRESWLLAWFFLPLSALQWVALGSVVANSLRRNPREE